MESWYEVWVIGETGKWSFVQYSSSATGNDWVKHYIKMVKQRGHKVEVRGPFRAPAGCVD